MGKKGKKSRKTKPAVAVVNQGMRIFVKTNRDLQITLDVEPSDTIGDVKQKIHRDEGVMCNVLPGNQRLAFFD